VFGMDTLTPLLAAVMKTMQELKQPAKFFAIQNVLRRTLIFAKHAARHSFFLSFFFTRPLATVCVLFCYRPCRRRFSFIFMYCVTSDVAASDANVCDLCGMARSRHFSHLTVQHMHKNLDGRLVWFCLCCTLYVCAPR